MSKDTAQPSFEDALAELEKIVRQLEGGAGDLNTSIDSYERGITLKKYCEAKLKEAQGRIEKISIDGAGKASAQSFDLPE